LNKEKGTDLKLPWEGLQLCLLNFKKLSPKRREKLLSCEELKACRTALEEAHKSPDFVHGSFAFVTPEISRVLRAFGANVTGHELHPTHVICSAELVPVITKALEGIAGRDKAVKLEELFFIHHPFAHAGPECLSTPVACGQPVQVTKNTFVHLGIPPTKAASVVSSTYLRHKNPRHRYFCSRGFV